MLFFLTFYWSENPKKISQVPKKYEAASGSNIDYKSVYYYDFWRSCDTEDWSNDAENTALITEINYSLNYIKIENCYFKLQ